MGYHSEDTDGREEREENIAFAQAFGDEAGDGDDVFGGVDGDWVGGLLAHSHSGMGVGQ